MRLKEEVRYVSMSEATERLGVDRQTAYRWAWSGELTTVKVGGRRLVPLDALTVNLDRAGRGCVERN